MKKILKWVGIIFVGIMVLGAIGGSKGGGTEKSSTGNNNSITESKAEPTTTPEVLKVDTKAFIAEFDKNQLAAEEKYKGKMVELTAYVGNISEDILGNPFLSLNPTVEKYYLGTNIQCVFKEKSQLTSLANGQKVTVEGKADNQSLGIIGIKDCKVVE